MTRTPNAVSRILCLMSFVAVIFAMGCETTQIRSEDLGRAVEVGATVAGRDSQEAARYGAAARALTGAVAEVDIETEMALGGGIALRAFEHIGPRHPDEDLQRYVNLVGKSVARQSERPNLPYMFAVLENPAPNAFAGPGGYVFITTGALRLMSDEAELAGVLGHEIAHVSRGHILQTYRRTRAFDALFTTAAAFREDAERYGQAVDAASETLFDRGLEQRFEFEADDLGMEMAALTGYDPQGLVRFLQSLSQVRGETGGWFQTHPASSTRIQRLQRQLREDYAGIEGVRQRERFQREVIARLGPASQPTSMLLSTD